MLRSYCRGVKKKRNNRAEGTNLDFVESNVYVNLYLNFVASHFFHRSVTAIITKDVTFRVQTFIVDNKRLLS